jgi:hypothetical protein
MEIGEKILLHTFLTFKAYCILFLKGKPERLGISGYPHSFEVNVNAYQVAPVLIFIFVSRRRTVPGRRM